MSLHFPQGAGYLDQIAHSKHGGGAITIRKALPAYYYYYYYY